MNEILSVIIPVYNEEKTLKRCLDAVLSQGLVKELIVVDDGSTDGTHQILNGLSNICEKIKIKLLNQNCGKGFALKEGLKLATGDIILLQDADLEYNPQEYERLVEPILSGKADIVFGSRFLGGGSRRVLYFWHSVGNKVLTTLSNVFTNLNLTDMETCYKVFKRDLLEEITLEEDRFGVEPELTSKLAKTGRSIYEVPISYYGRTYAEGKKITWKDGFRAIYCIIKYR